MNQDLFLWLNNLVGQSVVFDTAAYFVARDLIFYLIVGFVVLILKAKSTLRPRLIMVSALCAIVAFQIIIVINQFYPVARPQATDLPVKVLIEYANNQSFPSQHTTFAFLLATLVFCGTSVSLTKRRWLGVAYLAGATIIGLSRIVVGVHWPLDVLVGALIGITIGYLGSLLFYD